MDLLIRIDRAIHDARDLGEDYPEDADLLNDTVAAAPVVEAYLNGEASDADLPARLNVAILDGRGLLEELTDTDGVVNDGIIIDAADAAAGVLLAA